MVHQGGPFDVTAPALRISSEYDFVRRSRGHNSALQHSNRVRRLQIGCLGGIPDRFSGAEPSVRRVILCLSMNFQSVLKSVVPTLILEVVRAQRDLAAIQGSSPI